MQNTGKKVGIFLLILCIIGGGYWYSQSGSSSGVALNERDAERAELAQANDILKSLQSKAIGTLSDDALTTLYTTSTKVAARLTKYEAYRTADINALKGLLTKYSIPHELTSNTVDLVDILATAQSSRAVYLKGDDRIAPLEDIISITNILASIQTKVDQKTIPRPAEKAPDMQKIKDLLKNINDSSVDIDLHISFQEKYVAIKGLLCKTDDKLLDIGVKGTVSMFLTTAGVPATTANAKKYVDECSADNQSVIQYKCVGNQIVAVGTGAALKPTSQTTACANGCLEGICKGGSIGLLTTVTATGEPKTNIKTNDLFDIKAASVSAVVGQNLTALLSVPTGCTVTTNSLPVTSATTALKFEDINCTTVGNKNFKVEIKNGATILQTQLLTVAIALNVANSITLDVPATITAGQAFSVTAKVIGGNGLVMSTNSDEFTVSLIGDSGADYPSEDLRFTSGQATISGLIFSRATAITPEVEKFIIKVMNDARTLEFEKEVTVVAPTTTHTWNSGAWGTCTNDSQARTVTCKDTNGNTVADALCTATKPATTETCVSAEAAVTYSWHTSEWSECIDSEKTRDVECHDNDGDLTDDENCTEAEPEATSVCESEGEDVE